MSFKKLPPDVLRQHTGLSYPAITAIFFLHDGKGRIFLSKRSRRTRDEHGRWGPGAGGVEHGEAIEATVHRELQEEFGVTSLKTDFLGYFDSFRETDQGYVSHWLAMCFAVLVDPVKVKLNEPEMFDDAGWFSLDDMPSPLHSQFTAFFGKFKEPLREVMNRSAKS
jgi:8-oxo-dGTP diphosphatase